MTEIKNEVPIQIVQSRRKEPATFEKKYCHPNMARDNYFVVATFKLSREEAYKLEKGNEEEKEKFIELVRKEKHFGTFLVRRNFGGTGRPRKGETKKQARERNPQLGFRVIIKKLRVDE